MNNTIIADNQVEKMRSLVVRASKEKEFVMTIEDMIDTLTCLERLAALERHLYNLVSLAYEEDNV